MAICTSLSGLQATSYDNGKKQILKLIGKN